MATVSHIQPQQPLIGVVRSVSSGDSLVIQEVKATGDAPKIEYALSHLTVPRLGFHGTNDKPATKDGPFAWESREFLRKKCIGRKVHVFVDYTAPTGKKYVTVYLPEDMENSLNKQMIEAGWASLFRSASGKENKKPEYLNLIQLETEAISQELGIHNKNPEAIANAVRPQHNIQSFDLFNKLKGKPLQAVVEQIRNASSYRVVILPSFHSFLVQLSGIQTPVYKRDAQGQMQPEAFAVEAETFITKNVMHRDVTLTLDTFDKQGNLYGTVVAMDRDVAVELLKNGYGQFVAWSVQSKTSAEQEAYKSAEQSAKSAKLRVWSVNPDGSAVVPTAQPTAPTKSSENPSEIQGKVNEIGNAGQISIVTDSKVEYKVSLASLKVPAFLKPAADELSLPKEQQLNLRFERYCAFEAKEWMRKRLIGQRVVAKLEYIRPANPTNNLPEKAFYSVYLGKGNVALGLVEAGLAKLLEHKGADNRALEYEALITAENKAKKRAIGLFANKENTPILNINDCSTDDKNLKSRAAKLLPHFRGSTPAVVDYVFSAQRYKVYCEKESCMINLSLSGIRAPKRDENEELSNTALAYAREHLHQHDVQISVDDVDKGGNFIGQLYINNKNFAIDLVENGYASVYDPMNKLSSMYHEAEDRAKKSKLGVWANYDPEEEQRIYDERVRLEEEKKQSAKAEFGEATVRYVSSPTELYIQYMNQKNKDIEAQLETLEADNSTEVQGSKSLKEGDLARIKSVRDDRFFRAKIQSVQDGGNSFLVRLIDWGDVEKIPASRASPLPSKFREIPALINSVTLAYLKASSNEDINDQAIEFLNNDIVNNIFQVTVHSRGDDGKSAVVLQDSQSCVNSDLLKSGLAKFDSRVRGPQAQQFQEDEAKAISQRLGIWYYGNVGSDDEDDDKKSNFRKGPAKKKQSTQFAKK